VRRKRPIKAQRTEEIRSICGLIDVRADAIVRLNVESDFEIDRSRSITICGASSRVRKRRVCELSNRGKKPLRKVRKEFKYSGSKPRI
jgi:hypothetical protein